MPSNTVKPSAGRVIRIINSNDHTVQVNQYAGKLCHKTPLGILFDDHFQPLNHTITLKNIGFFQKCERSADQQRVTYICRQICVCVTTVSATTIHTCKSANISSFPCFLLFAKKNVAFVCQTESANNNKNDTLTHNPIVYFAKCSRSK